jgi:hypothetical protein
MGYLNKASVTVDAILTKKGRELLSQGRSAFNITQFAVADDEIDYSLYDPAHPLGTEYYGSAIENMPIVEASVDETQNLRYKLVTFGRGQNTIPLLQVAPISIELRYSTNALGQQITVITTGGTNLDQTLGYTAILYDREAALLTSNGVAGSATVPLFVGETSSVNSQNAIVLTGTQFTLTPKNVNTETSTQLVIIGNETGATKIIPVTILPATVA